uniref:Triosephosphate isomerase n=1 Tax=candidate division CPR3 bacterium TaxID=2268181 RepID=A0A7C4R614_UNCC3
MRYYFICNWKMNPTSFAKAKSLLNDYNKIFTPSKKEKWINKKIIVCPSFLNFQLFDQNRSRTIHLGSQDIFWSSKINSTGKISAKMIKDFGAEYVIIGHSELRSNGDNEFIIREKIKESLRFGITPVVCLGYRDYIKELLTIINNFLPEEINKMILAYEPREFIGSDNSANPKKVEEAVRNIKKIIYRKFKRNILFRFFSLGSKRNTIPRPAIIYGGSVNIVNYTDYINIPDLGGFIIGRESLNPENIKHIATNFDSDLKK